VTSDRRSVCPGALFFALQGVATLAWWALIAWSPAWRRWFAFGDDGASLWMFFPSDMLFWCAGSLAVAWGMWRRKPWAATLAWVLCGAIAASVLHAATLAMHARAGWSGVLLMVHALILTVFFAWNSIRDA
jgi:hypothetical protein